ncbi:MAG: ABC-F family ATP-binding cassette domain-containing protein [Oscillospiraceae bacterium]|nr:ABC-F family ATP-binding cassette domain-containing protein [Oscillospiraceae bacterium]
MSVLSAYDLSMSFIERQLFHSLTFNVEERDKIGLIGANGTGKTTLFKILTGALSPDSGTVTVGKNIVLGYMEQHACSTLNRTVYEELLSVFHPLIEMEKELEKLPSLIENSSGNIDELIEKQDRLLTEFQSKGGLTYKSRTKSSLLGLGFQEEDFSMEVGKLSGGQKSKLSLAKLLLSGANLLLLDEPTNHLDINAVAWLEGFLKDFQGSAVIISHDRYFLDAVTNKTMELYCNHLISYTGNYTAYMKKKEREQESIRNKYENDLKEIKRIEGIIQQQIEWSQERNYITAASKQKEIDRIKANLVPPEEENHQLSFRFELKQESGNDVIICKELSKSFGSNLLFKNLSFDLRKGEKVFIMGGNGTGKTTLFRILMGRLMPDSGFIDYGTGVKIGYFDQLQENLDLNKDSFTEIHDCFPAMTQTQVRSALGKFRFRGDDVFRKISEMSGGERAKINLLKLMLQGDNFLLLDEPTNHLDTFSRESLEETLNNYQGTLLIISHDRYFVNKLADRILYLTDDGFTEYLGNYDYFLERTKENPANVPLLKVKKDSDNALSYKQKKEERARERKRINDINKLQTLIEKLDGRIEELQRLLEDSQVISDYEKLMEYTEELNNLQNQQEEAFEKWAELDSLGE